MNGNIYVPQAGTANDAAQQVIENGNERKNDD
jgi:hypothetical protein